MGIKSIICSRFFFWVCTPVQCEIVVVYAVTNGALSAKLVIPFDGYDTPKKDQKLALEIIVNVSVELGNPIAIEILIALPKL